MSRSLTWMIGSHVLEPDLLPPRMHINKELELQTELGTQMWSMSALLNDCLKPVVFTHMYRSWLGGHRSKLIANLWVIFWPWVIYHSSSLPEAIQDTLFL